MKLLCVVCVYVFLFECVRVGVCKCVFVDVPLCLDPCFALRLGLLD